MAHLDSYRQQMGGFDFSNTQRYLLPYPETKCFRIKMSSRPCPIKKQEPPSSDANLETESSLPPIPEPPEDPSLLKRTAKKYTMLPLISTHAEPEPQPIPSSSTSLCLPILNSKGSTQAGRPESAATSPQPPPSSTGIKDIWVPTSSWADTTSWAPTSWCWVQRESRIVVK